MTALRPGPVGDNAALHGRPEPDRGAVTASAVPTTAATCAASSGFVSGFGCRVSSMPVVPVSYR
eukprot:362749-Chlamydomonas_euryale.AAC.6